MLLLLFVCFLWSDYYYPSACQSCWAQNIKHQMIFLSEKQKQNKLSHGLQTVTYPVADFPEAVRAQNCGPSSSSQEGPVFALESLLPDGCHLGWVAALSARASHHQTLCSELLKFPSFSSCFHSALSTHTGLGLAPE